jgi:hypothetical protein
VTIPARSLCGVLLGLVLIGCSDSTGPTLPETGSWSLTFTASNTNRSCTGNGLLLELHDTIAGLAGTLDGVACNNVFWNPLFASANGDSISFTDIGQRLVVASGVRSGDGATGALTLFLFPADTLHGSWSAQHDRTTDALRAAMQGTWIATAWAGFGSNDLIALGYHYTLTIRPTSLARAYGGPTGNSVNESNDYYGVQAPRFWIGPQSSQDQYIVQMPDSSTLVLTNTVRLAAIGTITFHRQ